MPKLKRSSGLHRARTKGKISAAVPKTKVHRSVRKYRKGTQRQQPVETPAESTIRRQHVEPPGESAQSEHPAETPAESTQRQQPVETPAESPDRLAAAQVLAFDLPAAKISQNVRITSTNVKSRFQVALAPAQTKNNSGTSTNSASTSLSPKIQVTPSKLASNFQVVPSPSTATKSLSTSLRQQIQITPSKLASNFQVAPSTSQPQNNTVTSASTSFSQKIQVTPSTLASNFQVSDLPDCGVNSPAASKKLADFFSSFVPSAGKSPGSSQRKRQQNTASRLQVQPSTSVTSKRAGPVKLTFKSSERSESHASVVEETLTSYFSNFAASTIENVASVEPCKLLVHEDSVCHDTDHLLADECIPLDWDKCLFQEETIITHNTRRKQQGALRLSTDTNNKEQDIQPALLDSSNMSIDDQETDCSLSQMMSETSLQHTSHMESSPAKSDISTKTAESGYFLSGSEDAIIDSESEREIEDEDEEEDTPQRNSGRKSSGKCQKSAKECTCKCTCGVFSSSSSLLKELLAVVSKGRPMSYQYLLKRSEKDFKRMTGISKHNFLVVYNFVGGDEMFRQLKYQYNPETPNKRKKKKQQPNHLTYHDRLVLTLMRLRRGFFLEDLALIFEVSPSLIGDIFYAVVQLMYMQFLPLRERMFTPRAAQPTSVRPACLKPFKNYRATIDTTEVKIQVPYHYRQQGNTYSSYKSGNVVNYLVACNCYGAVSYISPGFEGSISDPELFQVSGICEHLHPDDVLLVDRGFTIEEQTDALRVKIVRPAFLGERTVFSPEEDILNRKISAGRIHVERVIRKLKVFQILKRITNNMLPHLDQIVFVIACLVNFDPPNMHSMQEDES